MDRVNDGRELCSICNEHTVPNEHGTCPCQTIEQVEEPTEDPE